MAIDIEHEILVRLPGEGHLLLPDRPPSAPTWWRWHERGVAGRRLEVVKIGSRVYTSRAAFERFAQHRGGAESTPTFQSPRQRDRNIDRAVRELNAEGI